MIYPSNILCVSLCAFLSVFCMPIHSFVWLQSSFVGLFIEQHTINQLLCSAAEIM